MLGGCRMKRTFSNIEAIASRGPCISTEMAYEITGGNSITIEQILATNHLDIVQKGWFIANACELSNIELIDFAFGCADVAVTLYEGRVISNSIVRRSMVDDNFIVSATSLAGAVNRDLAYAIYSATTRNPYDRVYSATAACRLLGQEQLMLNFFKEFVK